MTNNTEARAREVLAERDIDPDDHAIVAAMVQFGNERAAQERGANAAIAERHGAPWFRTDMGQHIGGAFQRTAEAIRARGVA